MPVTSIYNPVDATQTAALGPGNKLIVTRRVQDAHAMHRQLSRPRRCVRGRHAKGPLAYDRSSRGQPPHVFCAEPDTSRDAASVVDCMCLGQGRGSGEQTDKEKGVRLGTQGRRDDDSVQLDVWCGLDDRARDAQRVASARCQHRQREKVADPQGKRREVRHSRRGIAAQRQSPRQRGHNRPGEAG